MEKDEIFGIKLLLKLGLILFICLFFLGYVIYYGLQESDEVKEYKNFCEKDFYQSEFIGKYHSDRIAGKTLLQVFFEVDSLYYRAYFYEYINIKDSVLIEGMIPNKIKYYEPYGIFKKVPGSFEYEERDSLMYYLNIGTPMIKRKNCHYFLVNNIPFFPFKSSIDSNTIGAIKAPEVFRKIIDLKK